MENASKALLIAGAILLVIAIIAIGMTVFNNSKEAVGNANMDGMAVQSINSKYEDYIGKTISASSMRMLLPMMLADSEVIATELPENFNMSSIVDTNTYTIAGTYSETTGVLETITVTVN